MIWEERIWPKIVLSLSTPDSMEEDGASIIGCESMLCIWGFLPYGKLGKTRDGELGFAFWDQQERTSEASTVLPIWVNGSFRQVRVRLIRGKAGLPSGMHIVKKLAYKYVSEAIDSRLGRANAEWGHLMKSIVWHFLWCQLLAHTQNWMSISGNCENGN